MYLNFCPLLWFYAAPIFALLKTFWENISAPSVGPSSPRIRWLNYWVSLKAVPSIFASFLSDVSHLNIVWDINLCRWKSWKFLHEENINIALPQFKMFYFTCHYKLKLVEVCASLWFTVFVPAVCLASRNASGFWNPAEEAGDPGETNRISQLATNRGTKWHNTNLSVNIITLQINKWTTTVTL